MRTEHRWAAISPEACHVLQHHMQGGAAGRPWGRGGIRVVHQHPSGPLRPLP